MDKNHNMIFFIGLPQSKLDPKGEQNGTVTSLASEPRLNRILRILSKETAETWIKRKLIYEVHGLMRLGPWPNRVCGVAALELKRALYR